MPLNPAPLQPRGELRLRSLTWALLAGLAAGLIALPQGGESALRSGGSGFFYGLLAFHLQRVDPDDVHLQAGLVGAVCGLRTLAAPPAPWLSDVVWWASMMDLLRTWAALWAPLIGAAVLLHAFRLLFPPVPRP